MMRAPMAQFDVHDATLRPLNFRNLLHVDWMMPIFVLLLAAAGWAALYSAGRGMDTDFHFHRQIRYFCAGLLIVAAIICFDYRFLTALAPLAYVGMVLLLLAVHFKGESSGGAQRWISIGPVRLQPSEFSKLVMIYTLAWYLSLLKERIRKLHWLLLAFAITSVPMLLILKQPNLGTAASLAPLTVVMLFAAGARIRHMAVIALIGVSVIPYAAWQLQDFDIKDRLDTPKKHAYDLTQYQKRRVYTFLHPETNLRGSGWQPYHSRIAVGSGGLAGKGYLKSTQTELHYLPEHHTDFIFSLVAEEQGFIGATVIIGLFTAFLLRGLIFARDCPEMTGTLLAAGAVTILSFHVFVNIAITIGVMPVTGIPLPFLSYGGSFYMTTMACVGLLLNVPMRKRVFVN